MTPTLSMPSHYSIHPIAEGNADNARAWLKARFPDGKADELNFVMFSTSGVHGSYLTIEDIEAAPNECEYLTVLVVQPRTVTLYYGEIRVRSEDIPWLKKLRQSSWEAVSNIGRDEP